MTRLVNLILNQLVSKSVQSLNSDGKPMTRSQKQAHKRVRKVMKASQRITRI